MVVPLIGTCAVAVNPLIVNEGLLISRSMSKLPVLADTLPQGTPLQVGPTNSVVVCILSLRAAPHPA